MTPAFAALVAAAQAILDFKNWDREGPTLETCAALEFALARVENEERGALASVDKTCPTCGQWIDREAGDPKPNSPGDHDPGPHVAKAYA